MLATIPYKLHRFQANMVFTNLKDHDLLKTVVFDCTVLSAALGERSARSRNDTFAE